ncbi:homeobox protein notochord [Manis pentadactyla]|uniref:homeobox protein notochord n=1 Tax=Manis pentadactyla TaxID=143292 RepID=UPI001876DAED|nr:homeobox protein notochord [Manis pentadactyla]KAI5145719.1 Homeobox Protein Notochord [Manis pentadactyla]
MPSPGPRGRRPPALSGASVQPPSSGRSPAPASPRRSADSGTPRAPGRLESSFSVEAILARPARRAPAASPGPVSVSAAPGLWTAPSRFPAPVLPWALPATWLPAYLRPPVSGLRVAHFCGLQGFGVPGVELAHHSGLWGPLDWAPAKDLQDTERPQKRVRTMFNLEQLEELEKAFGQQHNLVGKKRAQLAAQLNLTENQVRVWFQNRRVKYQKQQRLKLPATSAMAASLDEPSSSSDTSIQREDADSGVDS